MLRVTSLLVLGGTGFVGRAVVEEGLLRGWQVTMFNRGHVPTVDPSIHRVIGDRLIPETLTGLQHDEWDIVVDTWSGAPRAVLDSSNVLRDRTGHFVYISSGSVYAPPVPLGVTETSPTVPGDANAESGDYPDLKRGAELAVAEVFGERALMARAGLILGPHEDVGRLTWWLNRMASGGEILAPGPADLQIQLIDARDVAIFALDAALAHETGPFNVISRRGHATMYSLLESCRTVAGTADAHLTWVDPAAIAAAGIEAWSELPIWLPPDSPSIAMHAANSDRAHAAGLRCRPVEQTVRDTWEWLAALDGPAPLRADLEPPGLDRQRELDAIAAWNA